MPSDRASIKAYYQDFSRLVGEQDWRVPNGRHERLRLELDLLLGGARGLRILDLGCGAGVMSAFLTRYGDVTGTDFSVPAIRLATAMEPRARFFSGSLDALPGGERFELITLFDVLEHVPPPDRAELLAAIRARLEPSGFVVLSTPHPGFTRFLHRERPDLLQVVDEAVDVESLVNLAGGIGLELEKYVTYDVDPVNQRQYQLVVLGPVGAPNALYVPALGHHLKAKLLSASNPVGRALRPWPTALRLLSRGRLRAAHWLLRGAGSPPS